MLKNTLHQLLLLLSMENLLRFHFKKIDVFPEKTRNAGEKLFVFEKTTIVGAFSIKIVKKVNQNSLRYNFWVLRN